MGQPAVDHPERGWDDLTLPHMPLGVRRERPLAIGEPPSEREVPIALFREPASRDLA
ncbi:MAG: hypothetical protein ACT4R6_02095 [Gemmatimonadaceae bacterium]